MCYVDIVFFVRRKLTGGGGKKRHRKRQLYRKSSGDKEAGVLWGRQALAFRTVVRLLYLLLTWKSAMQNGYTLSEDCNGGTILSSPDDLSQS